MRLNQWLARATGLSRRAADAIVTAGNVRVNGSLAQVGQVIGSKDVVEVEGNEMQLANLSYFALNKPVGFVCSRQPQGNAKTIYNLLPPELYDLKSVGRLDKDSSGLLLLTNDGELAQKLTHPSYRKSKCYQLLLNRSLSLTDQKAVERGIMLDDGLSQFKLTGSGKVWEATLTEGRNRQIRRTFAALGYTVIKLHRTRLGKLELGNLAVGKYRAVKPEEIS